MKNLLMIILLGAFTFTYAQERKQPSPEERADKKIERLDTELQLSETQKEDLKTFFVEQMENNQERRVAITENRKQMREKRQERRNMREQRQERRNVMRENIDQRRAQTATYMKEVLTEEQFEKWQEIKEERSQVGREKRQERRKERVGNSMNERQNRGENASEKRTKSRNSGNRG